MQLAISRHVAHTILVSGLIIGVAACGGGSSSGTSPATSTATASQNGSVSMLVSDASSDDWGTIGVKILSIALIPQGGGSAVTVFTASATPPVVNLEQLDQISEILGNVSVPAGTYTGATLTIAGNPGDVQLVAAAEPEAGFAGSPGAAIPAAQIQIQGAQGSAGNLSVPVKVNFQSPLVVTAGQNNALDLEFDLNHPAFIVAHDPPSAMGATLYAVNFNGPVRHHPIADLTQLVLRHTYGIVSTVSADTASITITKDLPTLPVVNPETAVATAQNLQISADATHGTLFYDVDAKTVVSIRSFASEAGSLGGKYVRIAARYQNDGSLVAVRIWASSSFDNIWLSPEGHVLHVNPTTNIITVANESGAAIPVAVDANTQFFFRAPQSAVSDSTPIGTGTSFLANHDLVRGFKVHVSAADPLASPLVAQTVDIENAGYSGLISGARSTGFTYMHSFVTASDDYTVNLDYISNSSDNGKDASGNAVTGYEWWNFTYPTLADSGANAIPDFVAATNGGVSFGGTVGAVKTYGISAARWGDPANTTGWSVPWTVLLPAPVPRGTVATGVANGTFTLNVAGGMTSATVDLSTSVGAATLAYQVDRSNGVVTISPVDISTSAGLQTLTNGLSVGTVVKVYGIPQPDGTLKAYVINYFTGQSPAT
jgi:Domain of unknown function (DUF4382)